MISTLTFGAAALLVVALALPQRPGPARGLADLRHPGPARERSPHPPAWIHDGLLELGLAVNPSVVWGVARWTRPIAPLLMFALLGPPAAVLAGLVVLVTPAAARRLLVWQRSSRREAQLPEALERLASEVRAGSTLGPALTAIALSTAEPLGSELRAATAELAHGAALTTALDRWRERSGSGTQTRLVATALALAAEAGGEVARSIDRVASTLRERRELHAEARSLATQARASAAVLAGAPVVFTLLVASVEPTAITFLLTTPAGLACLVGGATLEISGALWMARILKGSA